MTLVQAIAREEGFYVAGSRASRNHNPGNIEYGPFAVHHGAVRSDGRFAIFLDDDSGFAALKALLADRYKGLTLEQALNKYAPPNENQTNRYLANVCQWIGCDPTKPVAELLA